MKGLFFCCKDMHDLPKVSAETIAEMFNLPKGWKMAKVTCPKLVKETSELLDFYVMAET